MIENLIQAAEAGNIELVQTLLRENPGIDINSGIEGGYNALHRSIIEGHYEVTKLLLESGANPNASSSDPSLIVPLCPAAERGNFPIMDLLLQHGADVNRSPQGIMRDVGISFQYTESNYSVLDYLKDLGLNIYQVLDDNWCNAHPLGSFFERSCLGGIFYSLGTFQDKIDISNDTIRKSITQEAGPKILYTLSELDKSCILAKISGYLVLTNLFANSQLDKEDQNFVNNISERLLNIVTEYNSNPDKLKYEFQKGSKYLKLQTTEWATTQSLQKELITNKIKNLCHLDHFIKAWSKTQVILPQDNPLHQALEKFIPLLNESVEQVLKPSFTQHFNQQSLQEYYQGKSISEMEKDPSISIFKEWFGSTYQLEQNHPHLSEIVSNVQSSLNSLTNSLKNLQYESITHSADIQYVSIGILSKKSIAFQEKVEETEGLTEAVELLPYLSQLKTELFHELDKLMGPQFKDLFGDIKLLPPSSTPKDHHTGGTEESKTQEMHVLGDGISSLEIHEGV